MGMPDNSAWSVESVGADVMTNGEDSSDLVITLRHRDGHALQHVTYFTLMGDVQVNGERPDFVLEGFVTSVDEHHDRAVSEMSDDDAVTRSYWVYPWAETFDAIGADGELVQDDFGAEMTESTEVSDGWIDLDYTGRYDAPGMELENEIETALVKYGKRLADAALYATDLDRVWSDLTAS